MNGIKLRFEEEDNQIGGRPIEIISRDYGSNADMAVDAVKILVERDKVDLIIGPLDSGAAAAIAPYLDTMKVVDIALAMHGYEIALEHDWIWQILGTLRMTTYAGGVYAVKELGYKTATTLGIDYIAGRRFINSFKDGFEDSGGQVVQQQWFPPDTVDFSSYLIAMEEADVLGICAFGATGIAVYTQVQDLGKDIPIFDTYQEIDNVEKAKALGTSPIGSHGMAFWVWGDEVHNEMSNTFRAAFKTKYGHEPPSFAAMGYNAASIVLEALKNVQGDLSSDSLAKALNEVQVETIFGPQSFGANRLMRIKSLVTEVIPEGTSYKQVTRKTYTVEGVQEGNEIVPVITKEK